MKKVEAKTLEEAYEKASELFACSIRELHCEVVQYPSKGLFGFFKKHAIILAECKSKNKEENGIAKESSSGIDTVEKRQHQVDKKSEEEIFSEPYEVRSIQEKRDLEEVPVYDELARLIENQLKELFSHGCFDIDVIEVDVRDNTALIFIDGEDAALLIGKEGYRYNALSYMIFSWLHNKYELFIKLEIASFITKQQEMIRTYLEPLIRSVQEKGYGKTRYLDGVLIQIALEQLREAFPDKYVAVKTAGNGKKFVVINDFHAR